MPWKKTGFFEPLSEAELDAVTAQIFGEGVAVKERRLIEGGLFNTSYFIEVDKPSRGNGSAGRRRTALFGEESQTDTAKLRRRWYGLSLAMMNTYVWAVEYKDEEESEKGVRHVAESIGKL